MRNENNLQIRKPFARPTKLLLVPLCIILACVYLHCDRIKTLSERWGQFKLRRKELKKEDAMRYQETLRAYDDALAVKKKKTRRYPRRFSNDIFGP